MLFLRLFACSIALSGLAFAGIVSDKCTSAFKGIATDIMRENTPFHRYKTHFTAEIERGCMGGLIQVGTNVTACDVEYPWVNLIDLNTVDIHRFYEKGSPPVFLSSWVYCALPLRTASAPVESDDSWAV